MRLATANLDFYPRSLTQSQGVEFGLAHVGLAQKLVVMAPAGSAIIVEFHGEVSDFEDGALLLCPLNPQNAAALRKHLTWLQPRLEGLRTSAGMGDRLGIATPGHVRATRETQGSVYPIFAQQSIREMQRTGRTPQQVLDDVLWGCFEEGWQAGFGSDADHLKTIQDIDACVEAGYTLFTIDPGQYVNNQASSIAPLQLKSHVRELPAYLQPEATGLLEKTFDLEGMKLCLDEEVLFKSIFKYGKALEHIEGMYQHLEQVTAGRPFEVEISMDETDLPTTAEEHLYIASELGRLGIRWVSFAPRFVGSFEKGVDYIGDLQALEAQLALHAAIARQCGPYKLSLHSGSDKFSIYPLFMQHTRGLVHLKTAGTSYLEALRTIAEVEAGLFEEIYTFAREHFETDRQSYHLSAQIKNAPKPGDITDWPALLDQFDAREILHVTFGSVLTSIAEDGKPLFYDRVMNALKANRERYFTDLVKHFRSHLDPFSTHTGI